MEKKILLAIDDSVYSSNSLHYVGKLFQGMESIHVHLLSLVMTGQAPTDSEWMDELGLLSSLRPEAQKRYAKAQKCINRAEEILGRYDLSAEQISGKVHLVKDQNPALAIIQAARAGMYDALVIGRRGISKLEEMILGSVSTTILDKCIDIPIWVIDGEITPRKFLVPVDGTAHTLRAVDHLAFILKDLPRAEVTFFHSPQMFEKKKEIDSGAVCDFVEEECDDDDRQLTDNVFDGPEKILLASGFPAERINRKVTSKGFIPSRQIVRQALIGDYGTIVMGRRKTHLKSGIFRGVSDKVILMAEGVALWLVV